MESLTNLVSIIIPTYNRAHLIGETIKSVLQQTHQNWELIIVDDGSTDSTKQVIESFKDNRIRYHFFTHGHGIIDRLRNFGIENTSGDLVTWLDSDDLWLPENLARRVELMQRYQDAMFSFSNAYEFTENNMISIDEVFTKRNKEQDDVFVGKLLLPLLEGHYVAYPSVVFKRTAIEKIGIMDETLKNCHGFEYFLRLAANFEGIAINEKLIKVRKHEQSTSLNRPIDSYTGTFQIINRYHKSQHIPNGLYHHLISELHYQMGIVYLKKRNSLKAAKKFMEYIVKRPMRINGWARLAQAGLVWLI